MPGKTADRPTTPARARHSNKPVLLELAIAWFRAREQRRAHEKSTERLKGVEKELRDRMVAEGLQLGETIIGRKIRMKRQVRDGQVQLRLAEARKQGYVTPAIEAALAPFISRGDPYEVWDGQLLPGVIPLESEDTGAGGSP